MPTVLAISSGVVRGHVGNSAAVFALRRMGVTVWPLPTIILSNHPGYPHMAGMQIPPETGRAMLDALRGNGWLGEVDAILTGYMPTPAHVEMAMKAIDAVRRAGRDPLVVVDPIMGDHPKGLYVDEEVAVAIRDRLLPKATVITPNLFELAWLTDRKLADGKSEILAQVEKLARPQTLVTSVPLPSARHISTVLATPSGIWAAVQNRRPLVAHGTGDLIAALLLGHMLNAPDATPRDLLSRSVAAIDAAIDRSGGADELDLASGGGDWMDRPAWPVVPFAALEDGRAGPRP